MSLKDIKAKIGATNRTHKMTRAMEAVSAVKMRKTQHVALSGRPYARAALAILTRLLASTEMSRHPLTAVREVKRTALIVITSDKGLAGSVNSGVIKVAEKAIEHHSSSKNVTVYALGKKGKEHFSRRGYDIATVVENTSDNVELPIVEQLTKHLTQEFASQYDVVLVAYNRFHSTFEQTPTVSQLLPLSIENATQLVEDIVPEKGKWSESSREIKLPSSYTVESDSTLVLDYVIPKLVTASLYHMILEAKASEHSARMVAMKNASDKSKEVVHDLTRVYNRVRQAAITREVSEIISGREALAT